VTGEEELGGLGWDEWMDGWVDGMDGTNGMWLGRDRGKGNAEC